MLKKYRGMDESTLSGRGRLDRRTSTLLFNSHSAPEASCSLMFAAARRKPLIGQYFIVRSREIPRLPFALQHKAAAK
jgi:hypothetical protein